MAISAAARTQLRPQTVTGRRYGDFAGRAEDVALPVGGKGRRREIWVRRQKPAHEYSPPKPEKSPDKPMAKPGSPAAVPSAPNVGNVIDIAGILAGINASLADANARMAENAQRFAIMQKDVAKKRRLADDEAAIMVLMDF